MAEPPLCPEIELQAAAARLDAGAGSNLVHDLLQSWPEDPRLYFLYGSVLAGERDYPAARAAMAKAVDLAPGFDIARFQLGFLQFTSSDTDSAAITWTPLLQAAETHPLRLFAEGLLRLVTDDLDGAVDHLERGISLNIENAPLNRDMRLLIEELRRARPGHDEPTSATDLLLRQHNLTRQ